MSYASQFIASGKPVGSTENGFGLLSPKYLPMGSKRLLRTSYPNLQLKFPIGSLTGWARVLATAPLVPLISKMGASLIASGASGTAALQTSANNGVSWSSVTTASFAVSALVGTAQGVGERAYALSSAAAQGIRLSGGVVSNLIGGPTSVVTGTSMSRLIHASNLASSGNGIIIALPSASGNQLYYVDSGQISMSVLTLSETAVKQAMAWTGQKLLIIKAGTADMHTSELTTTGSISIAIGNQINVTLPEAISSGQGNIASDQNGTVVITGVASGILLSKNHGGSFDRVLVPGVVPSDTWRVQYSDGYFMIETAQGIIISNDGENWFLDDQTLQTNNVATGIAKMGSTIVQIVAASTAAYSMDEQADRFNIPFMRDYQWSPFGSNTPQAQKYIRAR